MEKSYWISLISLVVALATFIWTIWVDSRQRGLKKRIDKQEDQVQRLTINRFEEEEENKKKALVCAETFKKGDALRLRVINKGKGPARNIRILSPEIKYENSGIRLFVQQDPYPLLNEGDFYDNQMLLFTGHFSSPLITLVWDDDFGKDRKRQQALNLVF